MPIRKTHEQFVQEVFNLVGKEYLVISDYKNTKTKVSMLHSGCDREFKMQPNNFLYQGSRCPHCFGTPKKSHFKFVDEVFKLVGKEYEVVSIYNGVKEKVKLKHVTCSNEWNANPNEFLRGSRCPECATNKKKDTSIFKQEVFNIVGDEYGVIGKYVNAFTKIDLLHYECASLIRMTPNNFLSGQRCLKCRKSKGEERILSLLMESKISFIEQYRFDDCRDKRTLPFDFAIFDEDEENNLKMLIEYDGEQHYRPWCFKDKELAIEKFLTIKKHDSIKTQYCLDNNIKLLRIPYWDFNNIEKILDDNIKFQHPITI